MTRTSKTWTSVNPTTNKATVFIRYTGEGKITTLTNAAMKALNNSAGVAVNHYRVATFKEWGKTYWAHETGADYNETSVTYSLAR